MSTILRTAGELGGWLEERRGRGPVGFVPTMGALHEGHLELMRASKAESATTVVSIFVNPLQFGPKEDFSRYPRDLERDAGLCAGVGVDAIFAPEPGEMVPAGFVTAVEVLGLSEVLEGKIRPGHFRGVATVVLKLLHLVRPARAYFGQKDYQQTVVVRRMVRDLSAPYEIVVRPTVREADGLAMSSRNVYLSSEERADAVGLSRCLREMASRAEAGETEVAVLREAGLAVLAGTPRVQPEYLEVVAAETLEPLERLEGVPAVALMAARVGATRLIDNWVLTGPWKGSGPGVKGV